jgi:hypothetical protein
MDNIGIAFFDSDDAYISRSDHKTTATREITTPSNAAYICIWVSNYPSAVTEADFLSFEPMLLVGSCSEQPAYEPYVGDNFHWPDGLKSGFPSVKMLGKTEQQSYTGKNLFSLIGREQIELEWGTPDSVRNFDGNGIYLHLAANNYSNPNSGNSMRVDMDEGAMFIEGPNVGYGIGVDFRIVPGETYIVSHSNAENSNIMVSFYDENCAFQSYVDPRGSSFTVPENSYWCIIIFNTMREGGTSFHNIQLEKGSVATAYEPYVGGIPSPSPDHPQEVKVNNACVASRGRNLLKLADQTFTADTGDVFTISNGLVSDDGVAGSTLVLFDILGRTSRPFFSPGTYTLYTGVDADAHYFLYDENGNMEKSDYISVSKIAVFEMSAPFQFGGILIYHNREYLLPGPTYPMLLRGSYTLETLPEGEPYFDGGEATAPELHAIGDYKDEWDPQTGKGIRRVGKMVLSGSDPYVIQNNFTDTIQYSINPDGLINTPSRNNVFVLCSHLPTEASFLDKEHCMGRNDSLHFFVGRNRLQGTTIAAWIKAQYDAGTPITIWYVLDEPVPFQTNPQRLTCPTGYGQIIQTAGDVPNAPLEVKYLAHGGNVK